MQTLQSQTTHSPENKPDISYNIHLDTTKKAIVINVGCHFESGTAEYTDICFFPQPNWEQHHYLVGTIVSDSANVRIEHFPQSLFWRIYHPSRASIYLRYSISQDSVVSAQQNLVKPLPAIINNKYFLIEQASMLIIPVSWLDSDTSILQARRIQIEWHTDPIWQYANSFGLNVQKQNLLISARDLLRSIAAGSMDPKECALRRLQMHSRQSLQIAIAGGFVPHCDTLTRTIGHIVQSSIHFWQDTSAFHFLAAVLPIEMEQKDEENGVVGFSITNAFVGMMSDKRKGINLSAQYLFAHEILHKWLNGGIFPLNDYTGFGYCAAEGFTDYVARYIMVQSGTIKQQEYVKDFNAVIKAYYTSAHKNVIADSVKKNFWQNREIMRMPYRRGDILAHFWASEIRKHTKDKHDFATALRDIMQQHSGTMIIDQIFAKALEPYIGRNVIDDILKYMKNGETIPITPDMIPFARLVQTQDATAIPQFELLPETK